MKSLLKIKRNLSKRLIGIFSFTGALFVFQACYGTPQDFNQDILIEGQIISKLSSSPIKGIEVSIENNIQTVLSDAEGKFSFYTDSAETYRLLFKDIDSDSNGRFASRDTTLSNISESAYLTIELEAE